MTKVRNMARRGPRNPEYGQRPEGIEIRPTEVTSWPVGFWDGMPGVARPIGCFLFRSPRSAPTPIVVRGLPIRAGQTAVPARIQGKHPVSLFANTN